VGQTTPKIVLSLWVSAPPPSTGAWFLGPTKVSAPKWHLDQFSRFRRAHKRNQQTDRRKVRPSTAHHVQQKKYNILNFI